MPFGLSNAQGAFQRLVPNVLQSCIPHLCLDYVDDIIVHASAFQLARFQLCLSIGYLLQNLSYLLAAPVVRRVSHSYQLRADAVAPALPEDRLPATGSLLTLLQR